MSLKTLQATTSTKLIEALSLIQRAEALLAEHEQYASYSGDPSAEGELRADMEQMLRELGWSTSLSQGRI